MPASQVNKAGERVETAAPMGGVVRTGMWAFVGKVGVRDEFVFMRKAVGRPLLSEMSHVCHIFVTRTSHFCGLL